MRSVQRFILLLVVLGMSVLATKIVSAKAVGIWLFDEGKGDTIKEAQGYKHDGEFVGGVKWEKAGKFGSAVRFDGKTGHIEIPDPDHTLAPKHLTLMAWVKVDNVSGTKSIMEQYDWLPDLGIHAFRINGTTIEWYAIWAQCQPCREAKGGKIKEKQWTHVVGTYDGKASRLYQDGKFVIESKPGPNSDLLPSNKSLSIGVRGDTKDVHWMAGVIDEAAIFDTALSLKEIQTIFKSPNGLKGAVLAVGSPQSKLAVTWGQLRGQ
ncbi:MAG: LamG domain-containing protein [Candidatus Poribacteria bacterium]|nr:LamG domain-containing protein [Candidatus Poribacteria bacterium]MDP6751520.1 LamG domain-containing protein [Candidatus Poribacteria bacterium]MDP6999748.1 LamG domain-containing protein [Candidatus Poribacteria bacterium]